MLLCVDPYCRVNLVSALNRRLFTDAKNQPGAMEHPRVGHRPVREIRLAHFVTVHAPTKTNLIKLCRWVHVIAFLCRDLGRPGTFK